MSKEGIFLNPDMSNKELEIMQARTKDKVAKQKKDVVETRKEWQAQGKAIRTFKVGKTEKPFSAKEGHYRVKKSPPRSFNQPGARAA